MHELISVVVPIYNVEQYLHQCINSIIKQTYKTLEIILVDDGSPDRCGEICDEYARIDSRIVVIHKQNGGVSDARNAGINIAQGKYLTFIDSDDFVHKTYVEKLYRMLKENDAQISICCFEKNIDQDISCVFSRKEVSVFTNIEMLEQLYGQYYLEIVVVWGKIFYKEIFENIRFYVGKKHEDESIIHKLIYRANKIAFTTEKLIYYRQHQESFTNQGFVLENKLDLIEAYQERADFFESIGEYNLKDKTYWILFKIYKDVYENMECTKYVREQKKFLLNFKDLKYKLRDTKQTVKFRIHYELYFIVPNMTRVLFSLYRKLSGIR